MEETLHEGAPSARPTNKEIAHHSSPYFSCAYRVSENSLVVFQHKKCHNSELH